MYYLLLKLFNKRFSKTFLILIGWSYFTPRVSKITDVLYQIVDLSILSVENKIFYHR